MTTSLMTVFLISMFGAWFATSAPSRSRTLWNTAKPNIFGLMIACFVMIAFAGLRKSIGDTYYYRHMLTNLLESGNPLPQWGDSSFLFSVIQYLAVEFGGNEYMDLIFIMSTSILSYLPVIFVFRQYSPDFNLSLFFYFSTGIYVGTMNGMRQYIAAAVIILATRFLFSDKKSDVLIYFVFVAVAFLFHSSALFMIPVYFVCRRKAWSGFTFLIIAAGVAVLILVSLFLPAFMEMLEGTDYELYNDGWFAGGSSGGANILRVGFHAIPMLLSVIFRKELQRYGPVTDILVNLSVVHFAVFLVSLYNWIFARFAYYTYVYMCILLGLIFSTVLRDKSQRSMKWLLYAAYMFFFFKESNGMETYWSEYFTPNNTVWFPFLY